MSQGTLFGDDKSRSIVPQGIVKVYDLDISIEDYHSAKHLENFPLGKVPAFMDNEGFKLTEAVAVILYLINLGELKTGVKSEYLGKSYKEYCEILKWISYGTSDFLFSLAAVYYPLIGGSPYNEEEHIVSFKKLEKQISIVEDAITGKEYLVGDSITMADLFVASSFNRAFTSLLDKTWVSQHPILIEWWLKVIKSPYLSWFFGDFEFIDKQIEPVSH